MSITKLDNIVIFIKNIDKEGIKLIFYFHFLVNYAALQGRKSTSQFLKMFRKKESIFFFSQKYQKVRFSGNIFQMPRKQILERYKYV